MSGRKLATGFSGALLSGALALAAQASMANDLYVSANGDDNAEGSEAKPLRSISKAAAAAQPGDRIIVRGGLYRESVTFKQKAPKENPIVLISAKGEQAIISGAEPIPGLKPLKTPIVDPAKFEFAKSRGIKSFGLELMAESIQTEPAQVMLDGKQLVRIGGGDPTVAGDGNWIREKCGGRIEDMRASSFYYDKDAKTLYLRLPSRYAEQEIGSLKLEMSVRGSLLNCSAAENVKVDGIEFVYAGNAIGEAGGNAVSLGSGCSLENSSVKFCGGGGGSAGKVKGPKFINCEFAYNGNTGIGFNKTEDFLVSNCKVHHNNFHSYNASWHTGGFKIIPDANGTIERCQVYDNYGAGIWFDTNTSGRPILIKDNMIRSNQGGGLYLEMVNDVTAEGNAIIANFPYGINATGSRMKILRNTISGNSGYCALFVLPREKNPNWPEHTCHDNRIEGNLFLDNRTKIDLHLPAEDLANDTFNNTSDFNCFIRNGGPKFRLTGGAGKTYKDLLFGANFETWAKRSGQDANSSVWDGNADENGKSAPMLSSW